MRDTDLSNKVFSIFDELRRKQKNNICQFIANVCQEHIKNGLGELIVVASYTFLGNAQNGNCKLKCACHFVGSDDKRQIAATGDWLQ